MRGERVAGSELSDVAWFRPDGQEMSRADWERPARAALGLLLAGDALDWRDANGEPVIDDTFLVLLNGSHEDVHFTLPGFDWGSRWALRVDTSRSLGEVEVDADARVLLPAHSACVYERVLPSRGSWRLSRASRGF